jgi:Met-zincin/Domain of unknown function (DUF5117)
MVKFMRAILFALTATLCLNAQTIDKKVAGWQKIDGYFPLYWDAKAGHIYVEINRFSTEFLYIDQLVEGLGLAALDRGQMGLPKVVRFERSGPKILLVASNHAWRSLSNNAGERRAVRDSFSESVLWGFTTAAEDSVTHVLIDATDFFLRDAHGALERIANLKEGSYRLDASRSAIAIDNTKGFPKNTEVEGILTFTSEQARELPVFDGGGRREGIAAVTPDPHFITIRQHQSFIELPDDGYTPRIYDIRAGYFNSTIFFDYSAPMGAPLDVHYLMRHRLQKKNPNAAVSEPVKPIVYYVDRGAPEPVRSALVEGTRWWNEAFEAAGFKNAFRVEVMPEDADPMDIRYNFIAWVHRSTRQFSNGASLVDPRTGEIIRAEVSLGSLRDRQDYMIAEALLSPYRENGDVDPRMEKLALQRMRQLAAHEVGHTLGLGHNHAASSFGRGGSVTDYPHPLIQLDKNGQIDLSAAYGEGLGEWDKVAIAYGYTEFPKSMPASEQQARLNQILEDARRKGMYYITTQDSAPINSVHPYSHQWDNGANPAEELERMLAVRSAALARFSEQAIRIGQPMALLEDTFVPLYLLHRYQTQAAIKEIGGLDFRYAVRGDHQMVASIVPGEEQRRALSAALKTLDPSVLTIPESILRSFPPRPPEYPRTRESFTGHTGPSFDPVAAAEAAAANTVSALFDPDRASRIVEYHARDAAVPSLTEVIEAALDATWHAPRQQGLARITQFAVERVMFDHLLGLAASRTAGSQARAIATSEVTALKKWLADQAVRASADKELQAHFAAAIDEISRFERAPGQFQTREVLTPPGAPIGGGN